MLQRPTRHLVKLAVLAGLWLVFSGKLDAVHLAFGVLLAIWLQI